MFSVKSAHINFKESRFDHIYTLHFAHPHSAHTPIAFKASVPLGCRLINVATQWVTTHLAAYQAWAASDEGAAQLARAVIICPAQLRPPLNAADERRILAELETGAGRQERLLKEREELQQLQRAATAREAAAVQTAEARQRELDAALREAEALRRRLATAEQRWRAGQRSMLARGAELATARQRAARLRWRLACSELMRRRQRGAMRAAVHAARTAEQVATAEVCRLRERGPPQPPAVLLAHLRRTAAGRGCSRDRRAARRFLDSL